MSLSLSCNERNVLDPLPHFGGFLSLEFFTAIDAFVCVWRTKLVAAIFCSSHIRSSHLFLSCFKYFFPSTYSISLQNLQLSLDYEYLFIDFFFCSFWPYMP